jgi:thioredoxin 1
MLNVDKKNFEAEVLKSKLPVVVDFWAEWCGPCRMMGPVFDELSKEYNGKIKFVKVNVDDEEVLASNNDIRGIPALVFFKNGNEIDRIIGYNPKDVLKKKINEIVGGGK